MAATTTYTTAAEVNALLPRGYSTTDLPASSDATYTSLATHISNVSRDVDAALAPHYIPFNSTTGTPATPAIIRTIATRLCAARCLRQLAIGDRNTRLGEVAQMYEEQAQMELQRISSIAEASSYASIVPDESKTGETLTFGGSTDYSIDDDEAIIAVHSLSTAGDIPTVIKESVTVATTGLTEYRYGVDFDVRFAPERQRWILKDLAGDLSDNAAPSINYRWSWRRYTWRQDHAGAVGLAICS